jgi:hypothetical protein
MASLSRSNVHDVIKNKPRDRVVIRGGERRIVKRPEARSAEQFVDKSGNVVWLKLLAFGTNHGQPEIDRRRGELNREGMVEHAWCPLFSGLAARVEELQVEFAAMPDDLRVACKGHPVVHERRGNETLAHDACPHVEWLIDYRRQKAAELAAARATINEARTLEQQKLELAQQQVAATQETNARLVGVLEQLAASKDAPSGKGKKDA